jgi:DNA polymerase III subunit epsilon
VREIIFDTETTGLSATDDRLVEIGCVEIVDLIPTGKTFHTYINPRHPVNPAAFRVHGLSNAFLSDKPTFTRIADRFLKFIGDSPLVAHNANFDVGFINAELQRISLDPLKNEIIDTLALSREKRPGAKHTLDALCSHFGIDNTRRKKHGALLDSELLAEVYVELRGGRQMTMDVVSDEEPSTVVFKPARQRPTPLVSRVTDQDRAAHREFVASLGDKAIWNEYLAAKEAAAA